jgi:hypothetical protein
MIRYMLFFERKKEAEKSYNSHKLGIIRLRESFKSETKITNQAQYSRLGLELLLLLQYTVNILRRNERDPKYSLRASDSYDAIRVNAWDQGMFCLRYYLTVSFY